NGVATAILTLPASFPGGIYTISASYTDSLGNYVDGSGTGTFTVNNAPTQTTVSPVTVPFNSAAQPVTLQATVSTQGGGIASKGTGTFMVAGAGTVQATVNNLGVATATLNLAAGFAAGSYAISASYSDASGIFQSSSGSGTLTVATSATTVNVANASTV